MLRSDFTENLQDLDTENCSLSQSKIKEELRTRQPTLVGQKTRPLRWLFSGRGVCGRMDTCVRMAESVHFTRNDHNVVNQLHSNTK